MSIRYRIWDTRHECFINEPYFAISPLGTLQVNGHSTIEPKRYIVSQFTGLQDRTGKDIYEGDIVKANKPWDDWGDTLQTVKYEGGTWNYSYDLHEYAAKPENDWEVVGNIWEQPTE